MVVQKVRSGRRDIRKPGSAQRADPKNDASEHQQAKQPDQTGDDERQVHRLVGLIEVEPTQLPHVAHVLNAGADQRKGSDGDERQSDVARRLRRHSGHAALLLNHLQKLVDRKSEADHGERGPSPGHKRAIGGQLGAVERQNVVGFEFLSTHLLALAYVPEATSRIAKRALCWSPPRHVHRVRRVPSPDSE